MSEKRQWRSKVGCHLIMKNEEKVLGRALTSMKGCWDTLCITDTGSTDRSVEIAKEHGAFVNLFEWCDDFGKARNTALDFLYETDPNLDWVMWFDCDDVLMNEEDIVHYREVLDQYLDDPKVQAINMPYIYSHSVGEVGNQCLPEFRYYRLRAFKKGFARWKARIHEYLESDPYQHINDSRVTFHHFREGTGVMNTARNLRILRKVVDDATPAEKPRYLFYYGKECTYNGLWDDAITAFKEYLPISTYPAERIRSLYELANCYKVKGDIDAAKHWAFEAIIADQRYADPYVLLAQIAYEQKDWRMCINWATIAPNLDRPEVYFFDYIPMTTWLPYDYMQASYYYVGDTVNAKRCLDKCISYKPHERRYLNNWSLFHEAEVGKIGIIIPTMNRKEKLINCINKIKENAYIKNYEIFIGVDGNEKYFNELNEIYKDEKNMNIILFGAEYDEKDVKEDGTDDRVEPIGHNRVGVPEIVESLIDFAKDCKYVTFLADDTEPLCGFLVHAYLACEDKNLVAYNDKVWNGEIACHWFAPRDLRDKLGGFFFHKGYNHVGCDNELTEKAKKLGLYKFADKAYVDHIHYNKNICSDKSKVAEFDECYKIAWDEEKLAKDREVLEIRRANNFIADTKEVKINIGSGYTKYPGYLTLDKYQASDIKADIFEPNLFLPETVDRFLSEHVLEHFEQYDGEKFIQVCHAALKKGGELEIAVPDMSSVQNVQDTEYKLKVMYGWQGIPGMQHKFGYTKETLSKLFEKFNFDVVSLQETFEYDAPALRIIGRKR